MQEAAQEPLAFFGLREQPFAPTADPAYFYATREHKECLYRLWDNIDNRHGIMAVLGDYGTGKTTLLRKMIVGMAADKEKYNTAVIGSPIPSWTSFALLQNIVAQFGITVAENSFVAHLEALNAHLLENRHRISTLIIDDAQNLNKRGQLELLRLVQNLEMQQHKLLNLIFFSQLEWRDVLQAAPNFLQRINTTYTLAAIGVEETQQLIDFRLFQAGSRLGAGPVFDEVALRAIHAFSEGVPRVVVSLCRNLLILAAQMRSKTIDADMVLHTIEKTTLHDSWKHALVVSTILEAKAEVAAAEAAPAATPEARRPDVENRMRDERAAQLLLKAAQQPKK